MSYEHKKVKWSSVIIRSKGARNVDFEPFWVIFTQHDPLKGRKNGHMGQGDK